jgi:hypothetical protein
MVNISLRPVRYDTEPTVDDDLLSCRGDSHQGLEYKTYMQCMNVGQKDPALCCRERMKLRCECAVSTVVSLALTQLD